MLAAVTACGGDSASEDSGTPASSGTSPDIRSIAIDPADGTMLAGSGPTFYRVRPGAEAPETVTGAIKTASGSGTLTRDVVVRFSGPGTIVASGHSSDAALPPVLGLVRSTDLGETWEPVSGLAKADYHEIEVVGDRIYALKNEEPGMIQFSDDGGKTFGSIEAPSSGVPIDVAVNPGDPSHWAVSNDQGVFISTNEGGSWRQRDPIFGARIAWSAPDALYSAGKDGKIKRSTDGGVTWGEVGTIGAGPKEFIVTPKGELYASVAGGEIRRSTNGGATWTKVITLGS